VGAIVGAVVAAGPAVEVELLITTVAPKLGDVVVEDGVLEFPKLAMTPIQTQNVRAAAAAIIINLLKLYGFFDGDFAACWTGVPGVGVC